VRNRGWGPFVARAEGINMHIFGKRVTRQIMKGNMYHMHAGARQAVQYDFGTAMR
jgi:hypothetical protein